MSNTLQFYQNVVPVDRNQHKNWSLRSIPDAGFSRNTHAVLLLGTEFVEAAREYPIVFVRNGEQVMPLAMLGLREGENLFVDELGKWHARYIPAYVRRYPFVFSEVAGTQQLLLSLDSDYPGLDKEGKDGKRLFDQEGQETEFLKNMLTFSQGFQDDYLRTQQLCIELDKLGLFKDMNLEATLPNGNRFNMGGFLVINEQKLQELEQADLVHLFKTGILGAIYAHLMSLGNSVQLVNRLAEREEVPPVTTH